MPVDTSAIASEPATQRAAFVAAVVAMAVAVASALFARFDHWERDKRLQKMDSFQLERDKRLKNLEVSNGEQEGLLEQIKREHDTLLEEILETKRELSEQQHCGDERKSPLPMDPILGEPNGTILSFGSDTMREE